MRNLGGLRRDAWKWENCLHGNLIFQDRTLNNPVFDIHYNVRLEGRDVSSDNELGYALVLTVQAKKYLTYTTPLLADMRQ